MKTTLLSPIDVTLLQDVIFRQVDLFQVLRILFVYQKAIVRYVNVRCLLFQALIHGVLAFALARLNLLLTLTLDATTNASIATLQATSHTLKIAIQKKT